MLEIVIDILFAVSVLMIIAGVVLKRKEKSPGSAAKPLTRYLIIGGPVLLAVAVVIAVLDPESRSQFSEGFGEGEKAGKEAVAKVLPKVPQQPSAQAPKAAAASAQSNNAGKIEETRWSSKETTRKGTIVPAGALGLEFFGNNRMSYKIGSDAFDGTYSLGAGNSVTFHLERELANRKTHVQSVVIRDSEMTVQDADGTTLTFARVAPSTQATAETSLPQVASPAGPVQPTRTPPARNQDLRKCLDLDSNQAIIKCAEG